MLRSNGGTGVAKLARARSTVAAALVALAAATAPALAVNPDEILTDAALETRARALSAEIRCVVCQNQSIDDSNAPIARDLRILIRERLVSGDTDRQTIDFIVARYGNFVLLKPPVQWNTALLWIGPLLFLIAALGGAGVYVRNRAKPAANDAAAPLSPEEQQRFEALFEGKAKS